MEFRAIGFATHTPPAAAKPRPAAKLQIQLCSAGRGFSHCSRWLCSSETSSARFSDPQVALPCWNPVSLESCKARPLRCTTPRACRAAPAAAVRRSRAFRGRLWKHRFLSALPRIFFARSGHSQVQSLRRTNKFESGHPVAYRRRAPSESLCFSRIPAPRPQFFPGAAKTGRTKCQMMERMT